MKESLKVDDSRVVHQVAIERSDFPNQRHADGDGLNISCRRSQCSAAMGCVIPEADHYVEHNGHQVLDVLTLVSCNAIMSMSCSFLIL